MATTPTKYDPQILAQGALGTTLTTTLHTAVGNAGDRITGIILTAPNGTARIVTIDLYNGSTGYKILDAAVIPADGVGVNVLALIGLPEGVVIDDNDLIRGGQSSGTDVTFQIVGWAMDD